MIKLKTPQEIELMIEGGRRLKAVVKELLPEVKVGVTTQRVDQLAEKLIVGQGGEPSFKRVPGYEWTICIPINEQVVHTPPSSRVIEDGDVITVDIGMFYKGFHTDFATSWIMGKAKDPEHEKFLKVGKSTLDKALKIVQKGKYTGEISKLIGEEIEEKNGYFIMKSLTGHGVGRDLHEDPSIPGYLDKEIKKTTLMKPGLVIAVEVIYSTGTDQIDYEKGDSWSIKTKDNSMSGCFEHSIAITDTNAVILT